MDYHFLRQVGKCLDARQKVNLKKPKPRITQKNKNHPQQPKALTQSLDEL